MSISRENRHVPWFHKLWQQAILVVGALLAVIAIVVAGINVNTATDRWRLVHLSEGRYLYVGSVNIFQPSLFSSVLYVNLRARPAAPDDVVYIGTADDLIIPAWQMLTAGALILGGLTLHTVVTYRRADKPGFPIDAPEK